MNIKLIKKIDQVLGKFAAACLPAAPKRSVIRFRRILVIRPGGIGDALLLAPALLALRERFPEAEITLLAERRNAAASALCPAVNKVILYQVPADLLETLKGGYDLVIDTEQWHRLSAVVARLCRAPLSIGFATNNRKRLFAHRIGYSQEQYESKSFLDLLAPLGIFPPAEPNFPFLAVPDAAAARVADLVPPFFATLFPGASIAERRWGAERFRRVANHLALRGVPVVIVGGEEDAEEGEYILRGCDGVNLAGKTTLAETAAVLARSALLLSGDSGVLHIAVGLGVPTVSLFGPGIEAKWGPRGKWDLVLNRRLSCSPCTRFGTTPPCPIGARCLSEITPQEVVDAVMGLLERRWGGDS